ncbi:MAG: hypothetical protein RLZZ15_785 [Verrucomicrobiota bacterium]
MAEAALSRGKDVPAAVVTTIDAADQARRAGTPLTPELLTALVGAHHTLAVLIAPATPRTMRLLQEEGRNASASLVLRLLGPIGLVRHLMLAATISLLAFIVVSYTNLTDVDPNRHVTILNTSGAEMLAHLVLYLSAAGLGASFLCLYKANRYVTEGTFDPMYEGSYWIRFFLGLISGLMLAVLVNEEMLADIKMLEPGIARVLLAIVGGFSAELFYTFLSRMVEALKSLFQGSADEAVKAEGARAKARLAAQLTQNQLQLAASLLKVQQTIGANPDPALVRKQLDELLKQTLPPSPPGT